jgi:hypothetical protein
VPSQPVSVSRRFVRPASTISQPPYLRDARPHTEERRGPGGGPWSPAYGGAVASDADHRYSSEARPLGVFHEVPQRQQYSGASVGVTWSGGGAGTGDDALAVPRGATPATSSNFRSHPVQSDRTPGQPVTGIGL